MMKLSRNVSALAVALVVNVLLVILLTPLGFETRPSADLKTVGYIAIGTIFAGLILDVASFALLFRRVRLASSLAIVGSILLFFPIFGDQTGSKLTNSRTSTPQADEEHVVCGHHPEIELGICSIRTKARIEQRRGGRVDECGGLETAPVLNPPS